MGEPAWSEQCARCANLSKSNGGRIWRCKAMQLPGAFLRMRGFCADARKPGAVCGPEGKAFVEREALPA